MNFHLVRLPPGYLPRWRLYWLTRRPLVDTLMWVAMALAGTLADIGIHRIYWVIINALLGMEVRK